MHGNRARHSMYSKPFLKWAGGKYRILSFILRELPAGARFVEPFAGSCSVYLNVDFPKALLCDLNSDLINLYRHIQNEGGEFIQYCASFFTPGNNTRSAYSELRERLNATSDVRERTALLLYVNRHAFNGLIRYNSRGGFNVPFGKYNKPYFPVAEMRAFYRRTQSTDTEFVTADFRAVFARLEPGDVVYCDPPYVPLSQSSSFTAYAGNVFTSSDQRDVASLAMEAGGKGIRAVLSNHDTELTRNLYFSAVLKHFDVQRFISCDGDNRKTVPELLAMYG